MSRMLAALCVAGLLSHATTTALTQGRPLAVTSATPVGEVAQIVDAGEIRIAFSEPMIDIGGPVTGSPAWFSIAPAVAANFYWSGTRTLIASIAPDRPLPYATRFTVRIDASARSAAGRVLGTPYTFTFVTPTVRLLSADWYRKTGRFDSPAVIALRFNQPVRAADVAAHAHVRHTPHEWRTPEIDGEAQDRLEREDPDALARFKNKVETVRRVASSTDPVPVRAASEWDERRFPPAPHVAVIETIAAPPPEAWLTVTLDDQLPAAEGPEKHASQQTQVRMEPAFFIDTYRCTPWCDPAGSQAVRFRRGIDFEAFERTLSVRDISDGDAGREVARRSDKPLPLPYRPPDGYTYLSAQNAGYERQAPATKWLLRIDSDLRATDGQPLGYTWMTVVDNGHERPYAGWAGQVWEARNGPQVPFLARNVVDGHRWLQPIMPAELMPLLQALRRPNPPLPSRSSSNQRLEGTIDAVEGHRIDLRDSLSTRGTGLVYAAVRAQSVRPRSMHDFRGIHQPTVLQITNLGLTIKDSPQSTLVFVTRLDNAEPVAAATVTIVDANNQPLWSGATSQDGIALAPALPLRQINNPWLLWYVVTAEKDGDLAWVGSDWTADVHPSSFGLRYQLAESRNLLRGSIFTDRGVYKQGEEIKVKGVLRGDTPTGMRVIPEGAAAEIVVRDPRGTEVDRRTVQVNRWSSIEWSWRVPDGGSLGTYSVGVTVPKVFSTAGTTQSTPVVSGTFLVAAFRRPDFRVDAAIDTRSPVPRHDASRQARRAVPLWGADWSSAGAMVGQSRSRAQHSRSDPRAVSGTAVRVRVHAASRARRRATNAARPHVWASAREQRFARSRRPA